MNKISSRVICFEIIIEQFFYCMDDRLFGRDHATIDWLTVTLDRDSRGIRIIDR